MLAALSGDPGMVAATAEGDLYTALATQALGRPQARRRGQDGAAVGDVRRWRRLPARSPRCAAASRGRWTCWRTPPGSARTAACVRSVLGRTCPPPRPGWLDGPPGPAQGRARARGRFTRNFVVQASAADWANVLVAALRRRLSGLPGRRGPGAIWCSSSTTR